MTGITRRSALGVLTLALGVAALQSHPSANHSWNGYHWARTSNPFMVSLGDNLSQVWDPRFEQASQDWNTSPADVPHVLDTQVVIGLANPKNCRPTIGRVEVCNGKYGNNGWLGVGEPGAGVRHKISGLYAQTPDGELALRVKGDRNDRLDVLGVGRLDGGMLPIFQPGAGLARSYTIVTADELTGRFDTLAPVGLPSFVTASVPVILRSAAWPAAMPTNSGFGSGSAATHSNNASMRSASEREDNTVRNTIAASAAVTMNMIPNPGSAAPAFAGANPRAA